MRTLNAYRRTPLLKAFSTYTISIPSEQYELTNLKTTHLSLYSRRPRVVIALAQTPTDHPHPQLRQPRPRPTLNIRRQCRQRQAFPKCREGEDELVDVILVVWRMCEQRWETDEQDGRGERLEAVLRAYWGWRRRRRGTAGR